MNFTKALNSKIRDVKPSGIRRFFDIVEEVEGVISLGIGEPDFQTPKNIRNAGIKALEEGKTKYTSNSGLTELRNEISSYYKRKFNVESDGIENVLLTVGASEALDLCFRVLLEPGDEVLVCEPSYVCYSPLTSVSDGVYVPIVTKEEDNFRLTPQALKEAITPKSKLLVLTYPNNPTGAIMEKEDLQAIAQIIKDTNIIVITDEIYAEFTFGNKKHFSIAEIPEMRKRTVIISGFSKAFAMTGWRLGYAIGPKPLIDAMTKMHQHAIMSAPTVAQYAAIEALTNGAPDVEKMRLAYDKRRKFIVGEFNKIGLHTFEPEGAFYCFPCIKSTGLSSEEFCERLLKDKNVAVIPGTAFGDSGEGFVRVSYCYSTEHIKEALKRIADFVEELQ
ncbi:MAG TPA: aminotransferase class I/II-fold pyridoxal phosphate-dependent enzyme [Clostridia bacterium]|nr:aminotransferase class I/II-fold pyridoxal phosphate-dependent enzyme [Clostridia bacterium]